MTEDQASQLLAKVDVLQASVADIAAQLAADHAWQVYTAHGVYLAAGIIFGFAVLWVHGR